VNVRGTRRIRTLLVAFSAACYVASLDDPGDPLDARGLAPAMPFVRPAHDRWTSPPMAALVRRDPFSGSPATSPVREASESVPDSGPDVPDIDPAAVDAAASADPPSPFVVRATIAGNHPVAYVAHGDDLQIVRAGDVLAGRRVAAIDLRGVTLSDGTRLELPGAYVAPPAPPVRAASRVDPTLAAIARLRSLVLRRTVPATERLAAPAVVANPPPVAVTPGPLPTVNARGLPVGVNPTPDAVDPTAFPYPYPYAPLTH
jgi:hypothetical protein